MCKNFISALLFYCVFLTLFKRVFFSASLLNGEAFVSNASLLLSFSVYASSDMTSTLAILRWSRLINHHASVFIAQWCVSPMHCRIISLYSYSCSRESNALLPESELALGCHRRQPQGSRRGRNAKSAHVRKRQLFLSLPEAMPRKSTFT